MKQTIRCAGGCGAGGLGHYAAILDVLHHKVHPRLNLSKRGHANYNLY